MSGYMRRLRYLSSRPLGDQLLVLQTLVLLGVSRLLIDTLTFRRLERFLGERLAESPAELDSAAIRDVRRIAWAIKACSRHTPWNSNCFPQAVTAKMLLRREGLGSTLYLGAAFSEDKHQLEAHAWLRCGEVYVTGGDGRERYGAVASFA